jgi:hypothetical protein
MRAQTIVTRSFDTCNQQSDTEQSNRTCTAPKAKKKMPSSYFQQLMVDG